MMGLTPAGTQLFYWVPNELDHYKKRGRPSSARKDGIPSSIAPRSIEDIYDIEGIPPVPAPSPMINRVYILLT